MTDSRCTTFSLSAPFAPRCELAAGHAGKHQWEGIDNAEGCEHGRIPNFCTDCRGQCEKVVGMFVCQRVSEHGGACQALRCTHEIATTDCPKCKPWDGSAVAIVVKPAGLDDLALTYGNALQTWREAEAKHRETVRAMKESGERLIQKEQELSEIRARLIAVARERTP